MATTSDSNRGPLSDEQKDQLASANQRASKVLGAAKVATFNGWTIGGFAAITLLFAIFSVTALLVGSGMAVVAWNEFRGQKMLRRFDALGPRLLGRNQLGFMGLIVGYCLWSIYHTISNPIAEVEGLEMLTAEVGDLVTNLTVAVYAGAIFVSLLVQGLNARYYFTRTKVIEEYVAETPSWIVEMQRSTSGL